MITFDSTTDKHTKEDLVKSIGADATKYVVKEVKKKAAKSGEVNVSPEPGAAGGKTTAIVVEVAQE